MNLKAILINAVLNLALTGLVHAASWTLGGAFDYETARSEVMYWADPNGGIGLSVLTDSSIPEGTDRNVAIGPVAVFSLDDLYEGLVGTILPAVSRPADLPARFYGRIGLAWETGNDHAAIGTIGTGVMLAPDRAIQPTLWTEYIRPEGSSEITQEIRTTFGVTIWF